MSWAFPASCSHLRWYAARRAAARGLAEVGDGGDQGDQLVLPVAVAVGDLVLHDADVPGLLLVQVLARAGGLDELLPGRALDLRADQDGPVGAVRAGAPARAGVRSALTRHSSAAPVSAAVHQSCQL